MPLGKSLGNILGDYFGEENLKNPESKEGPNQPSPFPVNKKTQTNLKINLKNGSKANLKTDLKTNSNHIASQPTSQPADHNKLVKNKPTNHSASFSQILIEDIQVGSSQTRTYFDFEKIKSLAESIKKTGLIQPIFVLAKGSQQKPKYTLIAGERRLRACKYLGQKYILAVVRRVDSFPPEVAPLVTAFENLEREDLSAIELAQTFKMLLQTQKLDTLGLAKLLNKSLQYVKNHLRLLTLTPKVCEAILQKKLVEGQARFLVNLDPQKQDKVLKQILANNLTVKEVARLVKKIQTAKNQVEPSSKSQLCHDLSTQKVQAIQDFAANWPNSKFKIRGNQQKGKLVISWGY